MKRFLSLLLSTVLACSLLAVPAAAVELPGGWWPVWSAFTEACDNGSTEEAIAGLEEKLSEELSEYLADHSLEEMADLLGVNCTVAETRGFTRE